MFRFPPPDDERYVSPLVLTFQKKDHERSQRIGDFHTFTKALRDEESRARRESSLLNLRTCAMM